ncbi:MAG: PRC-barrel domain-containing protein [Desulfamplus sp.]|nr:PRC-barrel domain-containing protein [Desulfamplus sp.]
MRGGYSILGSTFIGMEVENPQGESLGEVEDIMIDSTGNVRYAAVSYGGFMGIGERMYAVPMDAFSFKRDKDMFYDNDVTLILNVTQKQLKNEKGFDKKNWPNLEDENYRNDLDTHYNIKR